MRREELYLSDIDAADAIGRFIAGVTEEQFLGSEQLQSSVMHRLMVNDEAASRIPAEFRARHPDVEWGDIVGFRNIHNCARVLRGEVAGGVDYSPQGGSGTQTTRGGNPRSGVSDHRLTISLPGPG